MGKVRLLPWLMYLTDVDKCAVVQHGFDLACVRGANLQIIHGDGALLMSGRVRMFVREASRHVRLRTAVG